MGKRDDDTNLKYVTFNDIKLSDIGYYINLKRDVKRKESIEKNLKKFNILNVKRFDGVSNKNPHRGGSKLSHTGVLKEFLKSGLDTCLILEDDINFTEYCTEDNIRLIINRLKDKKIDLIWIGGCPKYVAKESEHFCHILSKSCAFGLIVKKSFVKKIEPHLDKKRNTTSADSFYNLMIYGDKKNADDINNILKDDKIDSNIVFDMMVTNQIVFNKPIVVESGEHYSNNTRNKIKNSDRTSVERYNHGYLKQTTNSKDINKIKSLPKLLNIR